MATGMNSAFNEVDQLNTIFDRIYAIERAFNLRMGLSRSDDTLPRRLRREPMPDGPSQGHTWQRKALLTDYYRARGWDEKSGVPLRETLEELDLSDVADDLEREGVLSR
jgi:aldehyde:ferredoxin oxidoreductase